MHRAAAMSSVDRMFRVIVAGGVALVAAAPGTVVGCGGSVAGKSGDAGFPQETGNSTYSDAFPQEGPPVQPDAFPQETGYAAEASLADTSSHDAADAGADADAFPQEGPNPEAGFFDVGTPDATDTDAGFPNETASP